MINYDRIVPIQKIDYLSMIGTIMAFCDFDYAVLQPTEGKLEVGSDSAMYLASEPVKAINFTANAEVWCTLDTDFDGVTNNGTAVAIEQELKKDGVTLYHFNRTASGVAVNQFTPEV